jgi:hypothetical protein
LERMTKSELLQQMHAGHSRFQALLAGLSAAQMTQPGVVGAWSVKDIVAHVVVHQHRLIRWLDERLRGRLPDVAQPYGMPEEDLAELNEQIYQEHRHRPLAGVLSDLDASYARTLARVEAAPEEDLFDPDRFRLEGGEPLWEAVAANTFWHTQEHGRDIRAWLADSTSD